MHGSEPTSSLDPNALVVTLEHDAWHTRTLVRRPLDGEHSVWAGVKANAVLVSTVRLPVALARARQRWETMAFPVYFREGHMDVDYGEVACRHAPDRDGAERNHTDVVREFSEGPSDHTPQSMERMWGKKCKRFKKGCGGCEAWRLYEQTGRVPAANDVP